MRRFSLSVVARNVAITLTLVFLGLAALVAAMDVRLSGHVMANADLDALRARLDAKEPAMLPKPLPSLSIQRPRDIAPRL